jgi:hypothetical protein
MGAYFFGGPYVDRARVGLLFSDASLGQVIDDRLGLYFQVTREFIDANLVWICHSPVDFSFRSTFSVSDEPASSETASTDSA